MVKVVRTFTVLASVLLLFGCNAPKNHLAQFNGFIDCGDLEQAKLYAQDNVHEKGDPRGEDLLWTLQLATMERFQNNFEQSTRCFDSCEEMMRRFDSENSELGHNIGAVAVNDNIVPYTGQAYDGVMVNTYKALNFMSMGQNDMARIEFNRALDRQRRSKEKFSEEIQKQKEAVDNDENSAMVKKTLDNPDLRKSLEEVYPSLYDFSVYPDFVNPFATYMAGIFFVVDRDYKKSIDLLKESAGMVPENHYVLEDLAAVEEALNLGSPVRPTIWVVFENGLGPVKEEFRVDLPLFIATEKVRYAGIALPKLVFRNEASPYLEVYADEQTYQTELISDIDRVVQTEFDKDFNMILTRAVISATTKAIAQYALEQNNDSSWAAVMMAVYNLATTAADVRIWTTLPKNIQIVRIPKPDDNSLIIQSPVLSSVSLDIPDCTHAIVYVKMMNNVIEPNIEIMTF